MNKTFPTYNFSQGNITNVYEMLRCPTLGRRIRRRRSWKRVRGEVGAGRSRRRRWGVYFWLRRWCALRAVLLRRHVIWWSGRSNNHTHRLLLSVRHQYNYCSSDLQLILTFHFQPKLMKKDKIIQIEIVWITTKLLMLSTSCITIYEY